MIDKVKPSADEAAAPIQDGAVIMAGGFMNCGTPQVLIDALPGQEGRVLCLRGRVLYSNGNVFSLSRARPIVTAFCLPPHCCR